PPSSVETARSFKDAEEAPADRAAPPSPDRRVVEEEAVADGQGAQVVLVADPAAGRAGEVVGDGAVGDGDGAVAGVAEGPGRAVEGRVAGDQDAVHGQVGAVVAAGVEPDGGALVDAGVAAEHTAGVDE